MRASLVLLLSSCLFFLSCKKDKDGQSTDDSKSTVIKDLAGDTGASVSDGIDGKERRPFKVFLFKLENQQQIWLNNAADSAQWLNTTDWDLAFTGIYNSEIYLNKGAIAMVDRPYAQVTEAPDDATFTASTIKSIGWETGGNTGWFNYSTSTHLMQPIKSRTFILKLNNGKFTKLELQNVYKGNPPAVTDLYWPAPYFTFRYFVQKDGSRNIKTQ